MARDYRVDFVNSHRSRDFLPELAQKYMDYIRPDIREVHIVHKDELCLLETLRIPYGDLGDEIIERVDMGIFADTPFVTERSPDQNADEFIADLNAYDLIMTTNLLDEESCRKVAEAF